MKKNQLRIFVLMLTALFVLPITTVFAQLYTPPGNCYYIREGNPWGMTQNDASMTTVFGASNFTTTTYTSANAATIFSPSTFFVFLEGSDGNANTLSGFLNTNSSLIQSWVNQGGRLFVNAAPNEGGNINVGFGGVTINYGGNTFQYWGYAVNNNHPIFLGPVNPTATSITGNYYAHAYITGGTTNSIIEGEENNSALSELSWGSGYVLVGGITQPAFHNPSLQSAAVWTNIIYYAATACNQPSAISTTPTHNSVTIAFTKAVSANNTFIQTRIKGTPTWGGTSITGSSRTINNLTANTIYEYRLRSSCGGNNFSTFATGEFTTLSAPAVNTCLPPTNVNAVPTPGNVAISWDASAFGSLYFIQIKTSAASWAQAGGVSTASTTRSFTNLQPNVTYNYRIRTTCTPNATANGMSAFSAIGTFTTSGLAPGTALFDTDNKTWSVYPNPTTDVVTLDFNAQEEAPMQMQVIDMTGRLLQSIETQSLMGTNQVQVNLGQYNPGLYIIKAIQNGEVIHFSKVSKQ